MELLAVAGVAALLFATTNIDDIFVLVTFFADPSFRPWQVVLGQFLGIGALTALSVAGSLLALVVSPEYIGLLGLLPFALGTIKLIKMLRGTSDDEDPVGKAHMRVVSVALVTIANGGDNVGAYVPVFASRTPVQLIATVVVFLIMTAVWCGAAYVLVSHPRLGPRIRRVAAPLTPFVLMAIGVLIVIEAGSYRLFV